MLAHVNNGIKNIMGKKIMLKEKFEKKNVTSVCRKLDIDVFTRKYFYELFMKIETFLAFFSWFLGS